MTEIRRPKRGETEDDLLNQQRQYFQKINPQNGAPIVHGHEEQQVEDKMKNLELTDEEGPCQEILQEIKERDTRGTAAQPPRLAEKRHFPEAQTRVGDPEDDDGNGPSPSIKKPSIFARNMRRRKTDRGSPSSQPTRVPQVVTPFAGSSVMVDGSGVGSSSVAAEIHEENTAILSSMTADQLTAEREALIKSLDPGTIAFLKSRRHQQKKVEPRVSMQSSIRETSAMDTDDKHELSKWPHMGKVEERKLEWMDPVDADTERVVAKPIGLPARFNFEGYLVDRAADLPPSSGLYHHGEEPDAAGYTLDELLHISRSSLVPQRVLALQTLAKVLSLCHQGFYDECLDRPLVPLLLEAGLVHILRWALDDGTQVGIAAAVEALAGLLVSTADEVFLDTTFSWHLGERSPCLGPGPVAKNNQEVTDAELVNADVIEGLVRMHLLSRLRYILEVIRPPANTVLRVLDILIRVARHSPWSAEQIAQCPRLLATIAQQFLPHTSRSGAEAKDGPIADVYGVPVASALKLFRVIAAVSRELSRQMQGYVQVSHFMKYLCDAPQLSLESLRTWTVFLVSGLSTESITECIPVLFRQLRFFNEVPVCCEQPASTFDCHFGSALFHFLLVGLNSTPAQHVHQMSWISTPATLFVRDWMNKLRVGHRSATHCELSIIGRACVLAASACDTAYQDNVDNARNLFETCILPFLLSPSWDQMLSSLRSDSSINCTVKSGVHRYSPSLPFLGSILWNGQPSPVLEDQSTVHFATHIVHALHILAKRDPKIVSQLQPVVTKHPRVLDFLRESGIATSRGATLVDHWFVRHETHLMHLVVELAALDGGHDDSAIYHRVCLNLPSRLQCGDEAVALRLLELSFHELFLSDWKDIDGAKLKSTRQTYVASFLALMEDTRSGRQRRHSDTSVTFTCEGRAFFPLDFVYSPIWFSYLDGNDAEDERNEVFERVVRALEWVAFLFRRRPAALSSIPPESHVCKFASAFMVGNDSFLLRPAQEALRHVLNEMSSAGVLQRVNFDAANRVDGIASFHDFFLRLLEHFEAVSYGDRLLGSLLLILVRQKHNRELRRLLWTEHAHCLRLLNVPFGELTVPLKDFLAPLEDDERLLTAYFGCLVSGSVRTAFCPVLYLTAIHHLHHFLFGCESKDQMRHVKLRRSMIRVLRRNNEEWHSDLLCYNGPDQNAEIGFCVVAEPPVQVRDVIAKLSA